MEDERTDGSNSLRIEYLLERVNDIESELFNLQSRIDHLNEQSDDMMRLLEQSIRVVEYLQQSRLHHSYDPASDCEPSPQD